MSHLLHIDSSLQGDVSVSRALSARARDAWLEAHPGGTVTYRDLAADPPPHIGADFSAARFVPADQRSEAQAAAHARASSYVAELEGAEAVVLGMPLYNYGPPTPLKAWVDHIVFPGLSVAPDMSEGLLGGRRFVVLASFGGGYTEGAPHHGWDHMTPWLPHILSMVGLQPEFISAQLTLANVNPAMAHLAPLAAQSLQAAHEAIDGLWTPIVA